MTRFLLTVTILSCALIPIALAADPPEIPSSSTPASAKAGSIYVKIIWPVDPATPEIGTDRPVIESWITKSIEHQHKGNFRAVTGWVPLIEDPFEVTDLWDGKLDGMQLVCEAGADMIERKDGWIKISFLGLTPGVAPSVVTLQDEPGSREVVPVTEAKMKHGMPHVAIFIGLPVQ